MTESNSSKKLFISEQSGLSGKPTVEAISDGPPIETRRQKINVGSPGGSAGKQSKKYRVTLPSKWVHTMGISSEERGLSLSFNGEQITIRKAAEEGDL